MKVSVLERCGSGMVIASGVVGETAIELEGSWYFAPEAIDREQLQVTRRTYTCPYKGVCSWIDLSTPRTRAQNIAWVYQNPKPGYEAIKDWIGFYSHETQGTMVVEET